MRPMLRLSRAIDRLSRGTGGLVAWLTLAMVIVGAYNAVARYLERDVGLRLSSNAYTEAQWYLFSLVFLLGGAYTLRTDRHVRVDVLYGGHSRVGKAWVDLVGGVVLLLPFCGLAIWASLDFAAESWLSREVSNDPGGLLRYPLKAVIPLAFALLGLQALSEVIKRLAVLRGVPAGEIGLEEPASTTVATQKEEVRPDV